MSHAQTQCRLCRDNAGCVLSAGPLASPVLAFLYLLSLGAHSLARFMPVPSPGLPQGPHLSCSCRTLSHISCRHSRSSGRFGQRVPKASPHTGKLRILNTLYPHARFQGSLSSSLSRTRKWCRHQCAGGFHQLTGARCAHLSPAPHWSLKPARGGLSMPRRLANTAYQGFCPPESGMSNIYQHPTADG